MMALLTLVVLQQSVSALGLRRGLFAAGRGPQPG
jgi:hypothetical protein